MAAGMTPVSGSFAKERVGAMLGTSFDNQVSSADGGIVGLVPLQLFVAGIPLFEIPGCGIGASVGVELIAPYQSVFLRMEWKQMDAEE